MLPSQRIVVGYRSFQHHHQHHRSFLAFQLVSPADVETKNKWQRNLKQDTSHSEGGNAHLARAKFYSLFDAVGRREDEPFIDDAAAAVWAPTDQTGDANLATDHAVSWDNR